MRSLIRSTSWARSTVCSSLISLSVGACISEDVSGQQARSLGEQAEPLIGGFDANSPALNAIGSIAVLSHLASTARTAGDPVTIEEPSTPGGSSAAQFRLACSGALLDERTVLTAKHCLSAYKSAATRGDTLVFALGPQTQQPLDYATVIAVEGAPNNEGGFTKHGNDVGVLHLDRPLTGVGVVKLGMLDASHIGSTFVGVGYGRADNATDTATRRLGALPLRAIEGRTYELIFGGLDAYLKAELGVTELPTQCPEPNPSQPDTGATLCGAVADAKKQYENTRLEKPGDALVGGADGSSQPCYGDSGGPLLRANEAGELVAYGVTSGGESSDQLICDRGAVYARFTPEVLTFLEQAKAWKDPCEGLASAGQCDGERARRCTTTFEGQRRKVEVDCAAVGMHCGLTETGAQCVAN